MTIRNTAAAAIALALAGLAGPAAAQTQSNIVNSAERTASSSSRTATRSADQRQICVRDEITGSRLTRNVCRTRAEWERAGGLPNAD